MNRWIALAQAAGGPLEPVVTAVARRRRRHPPRTRIRLPLPVISIGNLVVGGTGKTPATMAVVDTLRAWGKRVGVVMGAYRAKPPRQTDSDGRALRWALVCDGDGVLADVETAGDEALLFAVHDPTVPLAVGRRKASVARELCRNFDLDVLVVDDGFQHHRLARDLDIVLVDARRPFDNGRVLPAGMLREPPEALADADLIVLTHADETNALDRVRTEVSRFAPNVPTLAARHVAADLFDGETGIRVPLAALTGERVLAVCGIASPTGFRETLRRLGANVDLWAFHDHYGYTSDDWRAIERRAAGRRIVTTTKDAVKWQANAPFDYWVLEVRLEWERAEPVERALVSLFDSPVVGVG